MKKWIVPALGLLISVNTMAAVPAWQIVPTESSISFTATQNDAPVTGEFKKFSGEVNVDPDQLKASHIKMTIDVASITDPYNQLSDTLKSKEWFNTAAFPQAVFNSTEIVKTGDKAYQAKGTLTIRDKTVPVVLSFIQEEYTASKGRVKGSTTLQRTAFGVGQGEWSDVKAVKDDVVVNFVITAVKK